MLRNTLIVSTLMSGILASGTASASRQLCQQPIPFLIESQSQLEALKNCEPGDVIRLNLDTSKVTYSAIAARICNFDAQILVEPYFKRDDQGEVVQDLTKTNLVCVYDWKTDREE